MDGKIWIKNQESEGNMKKRNRRTGVIIVIAILLIALTFMDTLLVFQMTSRQTRDAGEYQLESISGELENTINEAKNLTMQLAITAQTYLDDREALSSYIYRQRKELAESENGCFNVYVAGSGWEIIPDLVITEDYVATQRNWYTGAVRSEGSAYVTPPYVDALTGDICYSVSVMLGDRDTVLAVDYSMESIQNHIAQMYENGLRNAVIATEDGIIAGCTDESLIGEQLNDVLPEYAGVFSLAKSEGGVAAIRIKSDVFYQNLFATGSDTGWYLIVSEGDWELYRNSYIQLFVTVTFSLALFAIIIVLYILSIRSQRRAETALSTRDEFIKNITGELTEPLRKIMDSSNREYVEKTDDHEAEFARIHAAGSQLSEMIGQILSYSSLVKSESKQKEKSEKRGRTTMNAGFRTIILTFLILVMLVSLYTNISVTSQWGNVLMQSEVSNYEYQLSEWINTQKSILDMFCSVISTHPEMLDHYEETVEYLNQITSQYPEISVSYMTNPKLEHTVYMNNGWEPDADWHVEERQWYVDTLASESGWNISAPYYDEQTGIYCVTISEKVYDAETGEFLGNFGIDFYMDKLIEILGDSYSDSGYAFLVDAGGDIINHPYGSYQMSLDKVTNISELAYGDVKADGVSTILFRDYDKTRKILIATRNEASDFTVCVVSSIWKIYGKVAVYSFVCLFSFFACIIMVHRLLTSLIRWQDQTNLQMKEATEAAVAAGNAKSRFLAQMSHEIRTPINAVLGMNEMILREAEDDNILEYASNIQNAGKTLLTLINSILDFSKIEDGKMEIIPVKYGMASFIHNLVASISERAKEKQLSFEVEVDETLPSVLYGDDVRLTQIISNLLTNAVKYTEEGKVTLIIREGVRTENGIELLIEVRDTGIGIRQEDMGRMFESFQRLDEKRNRNIEGTGLGMSIVTKLLAMMGSSLQVESVYGEGSIFSFRLVQQIVDERPIGRYAGHVESEKREEEQQVHLYAPEARILVTDDNDMNLKVVKNLLKLYGIVPDLASSGFDTVDRLREKSYHIVFLDHMMPRMDGIETLHKLKVDAVLPEDTAVIALTANAVAGAKESYLEAGFDDYLSKPIDVAKLEKRLVQYLPKDMVQYRTEYAKQSTEWKPEENEGMETVPDSGEGRKPETVPDSGEGRKPEAVLDSAEGREPETAQDGVEGREPETVPAQDDVMQRLQKNGLSVRDGMRYCMDDTDFYIEMLGDYTASMPKRTEEIETSRKNADWGSYRIVAHTLKSVSKTVGAVNVSGLAEALENAAKKEDADYIQKHHEAFLRAYQETVEMIISVLGENG